MKRALQSILAQTIRPYQILLIIDEIEDQEKYNFLKKVNLPLQIFFTGGGYGGAYARNIGLEKCETKYVFFLDDDDEWHSNKIEEQLRVFKKNPEYIAVTCSCFEILPNRKKITKRSFNFVNNYAKLIKTVGGFSCFGLKICSLTKDLRLRNDLKSAQDYEFYMRVSAIGIIGVNSSPLVNFYHHSEKRITTQNISNKESTLLKVLEYNKNIFSKEEISFYINRTNLLIIPKDINLLMLLKRFLISSFGLFMSKQDLRVTAFIFFQSLHIVSRHIFINILYFIRD